MNMTAKLNFPVSVDGVSFSSLAALATSGGVKYPAAYNRMKRGYSAYEIVYGKVKPVVSTLPRPRKACGNLRMIGGVAYANLPLAYEALKPSATLNAVLGRLRDGWTPEQAFEVEPKIDGRRLRNTNQASAPRNANSAARITYRRLIRLQPLEVNGIKYDSVTKLARAYGRSPQLVSLRIKRYGWTPERAVKEDPKDAVEVDGVAYPSVHSAWTALSELKYSTFCARFKSGLPLKISLGLEPLPKKIRIWFAEKGYATMRELAAEFGLTGGALSHRLTKMDLKTALNFVAPKNGRYSRAYFLKYPDIAESAGRLYFVRLKTQDGPLHKIGITLHSVHCRLKCKFELVGEFCGRLEDLFEIEQQIIAMFSDSHKRGDEKFEGKTETFSLSAELESVVLEAITELHSKKMN